MLAVKFDVNYEEKTTEAVLADGRVSRFVVSTGIDQSKERIEEHLNGALKGNAVMCYDIGARLGLVPDESGAIQFKANIHEADLASNVFTLSN